MIERRKKKYSDRCIVFLWAIYYQK